MSYNITMLVTSDNGGCGRHVAHFVKGQSEEERLCLFIPDIGQLFGTKCLSHNHSHVSKLFCIEEFF